VCGLLALADYIRKEENKESDVRTEMEDHRAYVLKNRPSIERRMRTCKIMTLIWRWERG
jgi:hypothetical protein